jgi:nucleoside-diphosphate-sugar epimerase
MSAYASGDVDQAGAALDGPLQRVTVISSGDVYATYGAFLGQEPPPPDPTAPIPETGALRSGRYPYRAQASGPDDLRHDYDKILVEAGYRARSPVPVTVLRLPIVYGPGDPHRRVATDLARLRDAPGGVLELHPQEAAWRCTRGYVDDVAAAIGLATTHPQALGQTYNLGEPDALSTREWLGAISQLGGIATEVRETPAAAPSLPVRWTVSLTVRTDRIRAELGYVEPIGRAEGLPRTVRAAAA